MTPDSSAYRIVELRPSVYQLGHPALGSNSYVIRGQRKNVLIDPGMRAFFPDMKTALKQIGLSPRDLHLIILTHEHFDHIGATTYFAGSAVIAAHRLAANKIELQDEFVTWLEHVDGLTRPFHAEIWLEDGAVIDVGTYSLRVVHTPGHTSGCVCLYEAGEKVLFTGDTVFSGGALSVISSSGSISDYICSLQRLSALKVGELYPGHGPVSEDPEGDILRALGRARTLMQDTKTLFDTLSQKRTRREATKAALKMRSRNRVGATDPAPDG
jgi:glyoxylase-like metal-dependent hydrolase (beta-lactamase superfamily II)